MALFRALFRSAAFASVLCVAASHAYFLSMEQKGQLMMHGRLEDTLGNRYNVRIVPGYVQAGNFARDYWSSGLNREKQGARNVGKGLVEIPMSLRHTGDYVSARPYKGIGNGIMQTGRAQRYLYGSFMGSNLAEDWGTYWGNAYKAHQRRSFGWWFAYPWATGKGLVNSTIRIGTGVPASGAVLLYGVVLRSAYEITRPVGMTGYHAAKGVGRTVYGVGSMTYGAIGEQGVAGTVLPVLTATWNTAVGTPMAAVGKAPTPKSTDGWWVAMLPGSPDYDQSLDADSRLRVDSISALLEFGVAEFRFKKVEDSLKFERDRHLDSLQKARELAWARFNQEKDSARVDILQGRFIKAQRDSRKLTKDEKTYLQSLITNRLTGEAYYDSLTAGDRAALVDQIITSWGPNILATPQEKGESPYRKTGPNTILQEEAQKVFEQ